MKHHDSQVWTSLADNNLSAAEVLAASEQWRSAISRSYYSAMASVHAILLRLGDSPPADRGNWSNLTLPDALMSKLKSLRTHDRRWASIAKADKIDLTECWQRRLLADYAPGAAITREDAVRSMSCARRLRHRLKEIES